MTLTIYRIASIFLPLLLSACASTTTKPAPARGDTPITTANPAPSTPAPNRTASPTKTSATFALLSAADEALAGKQPEQAILLMERAVRIEPRNFELWIRLSRAHLASGNLAPAI
ncbi:MAG: tetratricopeptide repeat protein, partial [Pseudomonadota bacterium]|nr:tetratricopeptide repeat protein [Pseudomonadota bacterium]